MATIVKFRCGECNKNFSLYEGLFQSDLATVEHGSELPDGGKLPSELKFAEMYAKKTTEDTSKFIEDLGIHQQNCDGKVTFETIIEAH